MRKKNTAKFSGPAPNFYPKWMRHPKKRQELGVRLLLATVGSHYLIVYRQPALSAEIMILPRYYAWMAGGILLLLLLQYSCHKGVRWLVRYRSGINDAYMQAVLRLAVLYAVFGLLVPMLLQQGIALVFALASLDLYASGYLDHEFPLLQNWIAWYACGTYVVGLYGLVAVKDLRLDIWKKQQKRIMADALQKRYAAEIDMYFMIVRKGKESFYLTQFGKVRTGHERYDKIRDMLRFAYVQINRYTYVRIRDVVGWDEQKGVVTLRSDIVRVFEQLLASDKNLQTLHAGIKAEYGLLSLGGSFVRALEGKCTTAREVGKETFKWNK